jgi:glycerol transport system ATP-binding protein
LLGGHTVVMDAGRIIQTGPTLATYSQPATVRAAAIFNDPPMNILPASVEDAQHVRLASGPLLEIAAPALTLAPGTPCHVGIRCNHFVLSQEASARNRLDCRVELTELSGSETYVHLHHGPHAVVAQLPGVHVYAIDATVQAYVSPENMFLFDGAGLLLRAPSLTIKKEHAYGTH